MRSSTRCDVETLSLQPALAPSLRHVPPGFNVQTIERARSCATFASISPTLVRARRGACDSFRCSHRASGIRSSRRRSSDDSDSGTNDRHTLISAATFAPRADRVAHPSETPRTACVACAGFARRADRGPWRDAHRLRSTPPRAAKSADAAPRTPGAKRLGPQQGARHERTDAREHSRHAAREQPARIPTPTRPSTANR